MTAFFVAASLVTVIQWLRVRRHALLPLLFVFVFLALSTSREPASPWRRRFELGAGLSGLAVLYVVSPRHSHHPPRA